MLKLSVSVDMTGVNKLSERMEEKKVLALVSNRAYFMAKPYTPWREGILYGSGGLSSKFSDGVLIYNTPYAKRHYYQPMNHNLSVAPKATDHWIDAMMEDHSADLAKFIEAAVVGGRSG